MSEGSAVTGQAGSAGLPRRSIEDLRFVVAGAFVADCFVNTPHLPAWGQTREARSIRMSPGGKALNQAVALARLGAQVSAVGVVGNDWPGRDVLAALVRERVDVRWVESRDDAATTVCLCFVSDEGDSGIVWHIDDDVAVTAENVEAAAPAFEGADAALITFEMPVPTISAAIEAASRCGTRVFLQPAPALADSALAASLSWDQVDVLVPNEAEARALLKADDELPADDLATLLSHGLGIPTVVVTLGAAGCVAHAGGAARRYPAPTTLAVDTTGAGDAFMATLTAHLTAGASEADAIEEAQNAAAWAVRHPGGHEAMPSAGAITPPSAVTSGMVATPPCAICGDPSARVELVPPGGLPADWEQWSESRREGFLDRRGRDQWLLLYEGPAAGNGSESSISADEAAKIARGFGEPYTFEQVHKAAFHDDAGFCDRCEVPYCARHWRVSRVGVGHCPQGHSKSLDPLY